MIGISLDFVQPDEGVSFFKLEPKNTCYYKYSRVKFIKPTINNTIFKNGNKILDDAESLDIPLINFKITIIF